MLAIYVKLLELLAEIFWQLARFCAYVAEQFSAHIALLRPANARTHHVHGQYVDEQYVDETTQHVHETTPRAKPFQATTFEHYRAHRTQGIASAQDAQSTARQAQNTARQANDAVPPYAPSDIASHSAAENLSQPSTAQPPTAVNPHQPPEHWLQDIASRNFGLLEQWYPQEAQRLRARASQENSPPLATKIPHKTSVSSNVSDSVNTNAVAVNAVAAVPTPVQDVPTPVQDVPIPVQDTSITSNETQDRVGNGSVAHGKTIKTIAEPAVLKDKPSLENKLIKSKEISGEEISSEKQRYSRSNEELSYDVAPAMQPTATATQSSQFTPSATLRIRATKPSQETTEQATDIDKTRIKIRQRAEAFAPVANTTLSAAEQLSKEVAYTSENTNIEAIEDALAEDTLEPSLPPMPVQDAIAPLTFMTSVHQPVLSQPLQTDNNPTVLKIGHRSSKPTASIMHSTRAETPALASEDKWIPLPSQLAEPSQPPLADIKINKYNVRSLVSRVDNRVQHLQKEQETLAWNT